MNVSSLNQQIAAARAYESLHVPALFGEWADPVLDAAGVGRGHRVLDVACGTGILARTARKRVGDGEVSGVDPSPGMLAVAHELDPGTSWWLGRAEELPFPDDIFDAVVCQFGMMFFSDRVQAVQEMVRVLRPGGRLAVAVWDALDRSPAYSRAVALLDREAGPRAADALRAPFVLGDASGLARVFREAGVPEPRIETRTGTARFPGIRPMMEADLRGWLPAMGVELPEDRIQVILAAAQRELGEFALPSGEMRFPAPGHIASARIPHLD